MNPKSSLGPVEQMQATLERAEGFFLGFIIPSCTRWGLRTRFLKKTTPFLHLCMGRATRGYVQQSAPRTARWAMGLLLGPGKESVAQGRESWRKDQLAGFQCPIFEYHWPPGEGVH